MSGGTTRARIRPLAVPRNSPAILILTDEPSPSVAAVVGYLRERDVHVLVVSVARIPSYARIALTLRDQLLWGTTDATVDVRRCTGIWDWHGQPPSAPDADPQHALFVEQEWRLALRALATLTGRGVWINHPRNAGWLESNKLEQLRLAAEVGFRVPPTILTNDRGGILEFAEQWEFVAVKSQGGIRLENLDNSYSTAYTQRCSVRELREASGLSRTPLIVQPYLEKAFEYRVTVIDENLFACRIDSQASERTAVDWRRYDFDNVAHTLVQLDAGLKSALFKMVRRAGLRYAGIDLLVTPDDSVYFLDLNPSGQFGWIEELTGAPITEVLCQALLGGASAAS